MDHPILKLTQFSYAEYSHVSYDSKNKDQLFPQTALNETKVLKILHYVLHVPKYCSVQSISVACNE
jgi:hypothetical protein